MALEVPLSLQPMEAQPVADLPHGPGWLLEQKYDGFRCIVFRDGETVSLQSRRQRPLGRYFPEIVQAALDWSVACFVLDGELVIPGQPFDVLQLRLHPAPSRVARLSREHPARFIAFDLLADARGRSLLAQPFRQRRTELERVFAGAAQHGRFELSRSTTSLSTAKGWLERLGQGLDGIVAKRLDLPYQPGQRAMQKFKLWQTVDCVVGGIYRRRGTDRVEYLLMGLYDEAGRLNYVGRCGVSGRAAEVERLIAPLLGGSGFTGEAPGGRSRWSDQERVAVPLEPRLVAEVSADHIEHGHFRHGSRLVRWREDKDPRACTMDQLHGVKAGGSEADKAAPLNTGTSDSIRQQLKIGAGDH
jgi:ATP-dependent DNA ligase